MSQVSTIYIGNYWGSPISYSYSLPRNTQFLGIYTDNNNVILNYLLDDNNTSPIEVMTFNITSQYDYFNDYTGNILRYIGQCTHNEEQLFGFVSYPEPICYKRKEMKTKMRTFSDQFEF